MRFANPEMLWMGLAAVLLLTLFLAWAWRHRRFLISQFVQSRLLAELTLGISARRQKYRMALLVGAVACIFVALARPQWGTSLRENQQRGLDIIVAMDVSRSMLAEDLRPNRLKRAQLAALDLMRQARGDRLGLVAFAGTAYLQCPLTLDSSAFRQSVEAMSADIIPYRGSDLGEAIETALAGFSNKAGQYRALVLLSDGEDHENRALEVAEKAAAAGIHIFTIGFGTSKGELIPDPDSSNGRDYIKNDQGNVVRSRLNESLLLKIATRGRGFYLPFQGTGTMEQLYEKGLAPLPDRLIASRRFEQANEHFYWPLSLAILLLVAELFLPDRKRVRQNEAIFAPPHATLQKASFLLGLGLFPGLIATSLASPGEDYREGRYQSAYQGFNQLLREHPEEPRLHFNAGAAAFQSRQLDQAENHFQSVLAFPNLKLQQQAYYNLGNTLYRKGQQSGPVERRIQHWEKAVQHYEAALKLNPEDTDAEYNRRLVARKLEMLQQREQRQQQQQQQQQPSPSQGRQPQQKPKQPDPSASSSDLSSPLPATDPPDSPQSDSSPDQGAPRENQPAQAEEGAPQPQQESKPSDNAARDEPRNGKGSTDAPQSQLTPEEAMRLLDAQRDKEKMMLFQRPGQRRSLGSSSSKEW